MTPDQFFAAKRIVEIHLRDWVISPTGKSWQAKHCMTNKSITRDTLPSLQVSCELYESGLRDAK